MTLHDKPGGDDLLREQIENQYERVIPKSKHDYEDVESLLEICSALREDMITVSIILSINFNFSLLQTFDACLALKPQRKDIIELYMKAAHTHMSEVLSKFWEHRAVELNVRFKLMLLI